MLTDLSGITYPDYVWDVLITSQVFTCSSGMYANVTSSKHIPTWRYRWFGDFPDLRLTSVDKGSWHSCELPVLFGNFLTGEGIPAPTEAEIKIGKYGRGAWAAFAKDPWKGLKKYAGGWPEYDPSKKTLVRLAYNNLTGTNLDVGDKYETECLTKFHV
jgi:cholinesterase